MQTVQTQSLCLQRPPLKVAGYYGKATSPHPEKLGIDDVQTPPGPTVVDYLIAESCSQLETTIKDISQNYLRASERHRDH